MRNLAWLLQPDGSQSRETACACCRAVANGSTAPPLPTRLAVFYTLELAETCCSAGKSEDEALLCQLLRYCSAALRADVSAAVSTPNSTPAAGAAAADPIPASAAIAASAAVNLGRRGGDAGRQPGMAVSQQVPAFLGRTGHTEGVQWNEQLSAQRPAADKASQQPQPLRDQMQPEWQSEWAPDVTL